MLSEWFISQGADAGNQGDSGGLLLYSTSPVELKRAEYSKLQYAILLFFVYYAFNL